MGVINVLGEKVKDINYTDKGCYDMAALNQGIYILKLNIEGKEFVLKFLLTKK